LADSGLFQLAEHRPIEELVFQGELLEAFQRQGVVVPCAVGHSRADLRQVLVDLQRRQRGPRAGRADPICVAGDFLSWLGAAAAIDGRLIPDHYATGTLGCDLDGTFRWRHRWRQESATQKYGASWAVWAVSASGQMQAAGTWRRWLSKSRPGGNTVAAKLVNFTYNADGQYTTISRYANLAATQLAATSTYGYNSDGQITSLSFRGVGQPFEADD
jgi:hypothetical protein